MKDRHNDTAINPLKPNNGDRVGVADDREALEYEEDGFDEDRKQGMREVSSDERESVHGSDDGLVFVLLLEQSSSTLTFFDDEHECQFLYEEYLRCRFRLVVNSSILMIIGWFYRFVRPDMTHVLDLLAIGPAVALVLQVILLVCDRFVVKPAEEKCEQKEKALLKIHEKSLSVNAQRREKLDSGAGKVQINENRLSTAKKRRMLHNFRRSHVLMQEALASVCVVYQAVCLTYLSAEMQNIGVCSYFLSFENATEDDGECPWRINPYLFWTSFIPIVIGQPRVMFVGFGNVVTLITAAATHNLHGVSPTGQFILLVLFAVYLLVLTMLKYFNESQLRKRYVLRQVLEHQRAQAEAGNKILAEFVLQITPSHLHTKLSNPGGILEADTSPSAICIVVGIHNSLAFIHSMLPANAATLLSMFFVQVKDAAENVGLTHIRFHGDSSILVRDLVHPASSAKQSRATNGKNTTASTGLRSVLYFALSLDDMARKRDPYLHVISGIAKGPLVGMPLGSTCIRYDLFGAALAKATDLAITCEKDRVHVDELICSALEENEGLIVNYTSSTLHESAAAELQSSFRNDDTVYVGNPTDTAVATAALSTSSVKSRMVKSLSSVGVDGAVRSGIANAIAGGNSTSLSSLGLSGSAHSNGSGNGGAPINFDPIDAICAATPDSNGSTNRRSATAADGGVVGHEHSSQSIQVSTTSTDENNATRTRLLHHRSLEIRKSCCFVKEFVDSRVQQEFDTQQAQSMSFLFSATIVFMILFLAVCCASVGEERGGDFTDDTVALSIYFVITGLCLVAFIAQLILVVTAGVGGEIRLRETLQKPALIFMGVSVVGCHFARRSAVGDDPAFLLMFVCLLSMHIGANTKTIITFQVLALLIAYSIPLAAFRPVVLLGHFAIPFPILVIINATLVNNEVDVSLFSRQLESRAVIARIKEQKDVQQRIVSSIIPSPLHFVFENKKLFLPTQQQQHRVMCSSQDDVVVLHISISMPTPLLNDSPSSSSTFHGHSDATLNTSNRSVGYTASPIVFSPSIIDSIRKNAEQTVGIVERLVSSVQHKTLHIVQLLGSTIVVAGPIGGEEMGSHVAQQQHQGGSSGKKRAQQTATYPKSNAEHQLDQCIADSLEFMSNLLPHMQKASSTTPPTERESCHREQCDLLDESSTNYFSCVVGIALEQTVNCLILNTNPSFDVLGPAVNIAKAIAECPGEINDGGENFLKKIAPNSSNSKTARRSF